MQPLIEIFYRKYCEAHNKTFDKEEIEKVVEKVDKIELKVTEFINATL